MAKLNLQSFTRICPMVYAYTTPGVSYNDGWTKIGYTGKQTVEERIRQQTYTAGIWPVLAWRGEARYTDGSGEYFIDKDFHEYLTKYRGVEQRPKHEYFHIDPETAHGYFYRFAARDFSDIGAQPDEAHHAYTLRHEQAEAVAVTRAYYESGREPREFLWNAKPRFGKTLTTYDFVRAIGAKNVLIVTNRPSIANSWFDDFETFIRWQTDYVFVSETSALSGRASLTRADYCRYLDGLDEAAMERTGLIAFESLQGLKGSLYFGGTYDKLKWIRDTKWDVLVIDEAHEGIDTYKTDAAFDEIDRRFTLHLSGTPFKAIAGGKFRAEQIFNWSYADEQEAKESWQGEGANPYEGLPRLSMYTYQLSKMLRARAQAGMVLDGEAADYAFNLSEFFATNAGGHFLHDAEVDQFLDALTTQERFPFSTPALRDEIRHSFWLLDRVASAKALAEKLKKHPVFKDYEVVLAAGDGRLVHEDADDEASAKSFDRVQAAIRDHERTITLSVGQLTTGVTVKPWTAVLMLSNMKSPAEYMQAAFRAQNPYREERDGQLYEKENAYLFDFAPERTLLIYDAFANNLSTETAGGAGTREEHEANIHRMLNLFPIFGEREDGAMAPLDAAKVLTLPRAIKAEEVVHRGFLSNFLFQNISNIFAAPQAVREVLAKLRKEETQGDRKNPLSMADAESVPTDEAGEVAVPDGIVISKTEDIFGKAVYGEVPEAVTAAVDALRGADGADGSDAGSLQEAEEAARAVAQTVAKSVVAALRPGIETKAKTEYDLTKKQAERIAKSTEKDVGEAFERLAADHVKRQRIIEVESRAAVAGAKSEDEVAAARAEAVRRIEEATAAHRGSDGGVSGGDEAEGHRDDEARGGGCDAPARDRAGGAEEEGGRGRRAGTSARLFADDPELHHGV